MMEIEIRSVYVRPNTTTPWWSTHDMPGDYLKSTNPGLRDYVKDNYIAAGDADIVDSVSDDGLILYRSLYLKNQEVYDRWLQDDYIQTLKDLRANYNVENNIEQLSFTVEQ